MIVIPSSDLRNKYTEITNQYFGLGEPIYLTKNGHGHAVLISIEEYERLAKLDLMNKIEEGIRQVENGNTLTVSETAKCIKNQLKL